MFIVKKQFVDEVHSYQNFVRNHLSAFNSVSIDGSTNLNLVLIDEQVTIRSGIIDILAYDKSVKRFVIIELKNPVANYKAIAQVIRYRQEMSNRTIDGYETEYEPLAMVVAPDFKGIISLDDTNVKLFKMYADKDNDDSEDKVILSEYLVSQRDKHKLPIDDKIELRKKRKIYISEEQRRLSDTIIDKLRKIQGETVLEIIDKQDKIDILSDKILMKIVFPNKWFSPYITLYLYENFMKRTNCQINDLKFDPAIRKIILTKHIVKIQVVAVPEIIRSLESL